MFNNHLGESMLQGIKNLYSIEIMEHAPEDKKQYFLELVESIPMNMFDGVKNQVLAIEKGKKLSSFLANLKIEMQEAGMDLTELNKKQEEQNIQFAQSMNVPKFAIKKFMR